MDSIKSQIQLLRSRHSCDDELVRQLNELVLDHGEKVCVEIFAFLASMQLPEKVAQLKWSQVQVHRQNMTLALGRNVSLLTAMIDFLEGSPDSDRQYQLIETHTLERTVQGTTHDYLTGLYNRIYFDETYEQQTSFARRYHSNLSVLFLDIDDFKEVNDSLGHIAGDTALRTVAGIINNAKRNSDISARFGGEEFVLLMPHTESSNAYILAERIRQEVEQTPFTWEGKSYRLTMSGGLASYPHHSTDPEELLAMADSALYLAKGAGKNTVMHFREEKRRFLRMKLSQPIQVKELGFKNDHIYPGRSKDIGVGGILFECDHPIAVGTMLKLSIPVHGSNPLLLIGRVVRVNRHDRDVFDIGMRISFKEMAKEANNEISNFIRGNMILEK